MRPAGPGQCLLLPLRLLPQILDVRPDLARASGQQGLDAESTALGAGQVEGIRPGVDALDLHGPPAAEHLGNVRLRHANALGEGGLREIALGEQGGDVGAEWGHLTNLCRLRRQCTFGLIHREILNSWGVVPTERPLMRSVRFAISAGPLTSVRLHLRRAEATRQGVSLLEVLTAAELFHLQVIRNAMAGEATWEDAVTAIEATT